MTQHQSAAYLRVLQKADSLRTTGKLKDAEIGYRQALILNKNSAEAFKGLGKIARLEDEWLEFRRLFEKALILNPDDSEAKDYLENRSEVRDLTLQADSLRLSGKLNEAEKTYKKAVKLDKEYIDALKGLGKIAYEKEKWKDLRKWLQKALTISPGDQEALELLSSNPKLQEKLKQAENLFATGDLKKAEKTFKRALKINSNSDQALRQLGNIALEKRDWGDAKKWFKKLLKVNPKELQAHYGLGIANRETGKFKTLLLRRFDFNTSKKHFGIVMQADSTFNDVLYQRGELEIYKRNYNEAIKWGRRQFRLKPKAAVANIGLYRFYRLFIINKSYAAVRKTLRNPNDSWSKYFSGEHLRRENDLIAAQSIFAELLKENIELSKTPVYLSLVRLNLQRNLPDEAYQYFASAVSEITSDVDAEFLFEDTKYIFDDAELAEYKNAEGFESKKKFYENFWVTRNPVPASPINFRALEHFRRLLFAEKNYWFDGVRSWANNPDKLSYLKFPKTFHLNREFNDKGLIYVRHGAPGEFAKTPTPSMNNESWYYSRTDDRPVMIFHFIIEDIFGTGNNWRLTPNLPPELLVDRAGWDSKINRLLITPNQLEASSMLNQIADESRIVVEKAMSSDFHTWDKSIKDLPMAYHLASFRGSNGKTRLEIYCGIPLTKLLPTAAVFALGAGIYNDDWNKITSQHHGIDLQTNGAASVFNNMVMHAYSFSLEPGKYNISLSAKVKNVSLVGGWNFNSTVADYSGNSLSLSDILLASDVDAAMSRSLFQKKGIAIIPNPGKVFELSAPLFAYYEIYNLAKSSGQTSFEVEHKITQLKKKTSGLKKLLGVGGERKKSISIKDRREGNQQTSIEYPSFSVSNLEPGEYRLTVTVTDLNSGRRAEKSIDLSVIP